MRSEVNRLATATGDLAPLSDNVRRLDDLVTGMTVDLKQLHDEVNRARVRAEKAIALINGSAATATAPTPVPAPAATASSSASTLVRPASVLPGPLNMSRPTAGPVVSEQELALAQGMKLFKQSRFIEALAVFHRLEQSLSDDARVWYFAALCQGSTTALWTGEAERLVTVGIERERAGSPATEVIDAAFSDLTVPQGRDWLAEYRRRAATVPAAGPVPPLIRIDHVTLPF